MNARISFLAAFLLAAGGSIALSVLGSRWIPAVWAVLVMFGFLAWVKARLPDYADSQGFADDFYFLGFLLTLVALATALLRIGDLGQAELLSTVLSQFSLALATTIVGLAVRTMLLLDKEETEGAEERARRKVEKAFDSLAQSLTRLSTEADVFSMQFAGKLSESLAPVDRTVANVATAVDAVGAKLGETAAAVNGLSDAVWAATSRITNASDVLSNGLEEARDRLRNDLDSLGAGIRDAGTGVTQQLSDLARAIQQSDRHSRDSIEAALERMARVADAVGSASAGVSRASEEMAGKLQGDLRAIGAGFGELRAEVNRVTSTVGSTTESLDEARRAWRAQIEDLALVQRELVGQATATGSAVAEVRREIAEGVDELVRTLRALERE